MKKNIGLFTSVYFNNIGNGFIDIGAEETLKAAIPADAAIVKISQCANFAASMSSSFSIKENRIVNFLWKKIMKKYAGKFLDKSYNIVKGQDVFSVAKIVKIDYLVLPGCVLTVPFFSIYMPLLETKVKQGTKLIFLGASGNFYNEYEINFVSKAMKTLKPFAIMTRDSMAYDIYARFAEHSYNGIDNAFFVNRSNIPQIKTGMDPYIVLSFDEDINGDILERLKKDMGTNYIITDHKPYPYSRVSRLVKKGIMCSDTPMDYLTLYSNVSETYSDRVHACIPTLAFGHKARLYSDSPRIRLFENVGLSNITKELVCFPNLNEMQERQISFLRQIIEQR